MANMFSNFFEDLGGSKMGNAAKFHDPAALKKWKDRSEKTYGKFGDRREKYSGRADKEYGRYGKSRGEAQRLYGKMEGATGQAQGALGQAAMREKKAGELADDRKHYDGLRERAAERRKQRESYRLDLESKAKQGGTFDAVQSMVMDAAKMGNDAVMAQTEGIAAGLAKTNPVAAAKLLLDANNNAATNLGKAKQQGWFTGKEQQLRQFTMDAQRIGQQSAMLGDDEQADRYLSEARGQQIQEQMGLSSSALNRSGASLNVAGMYGQQGQMNQQMAGQSAQMSQNYDEMGNQMLTEQASIEQQGMGREQELMLSDRMAQGQVDEYNAGRMGRGIQTGLQIAGTAASMYGGISAGMAANAAADMYGNQTSQGAGGGQLASNNSPGGWSPGAKGDGLPAHLTRSNGKGVRSFQGGRQMGLSNNRGSYNLTGSGGRTMGIGDNFAQDNASQRFGKSDYNRGGFSNNKIARRRMTQQWTSNMSPGGSIKNNWSKG